MLVSGRSVVICIWCLFFNYYVDAESNTNEINISVLMENVNFDQKKNSVNLRPLLIIPVVVDSSGNNSININENKTYTVRLRRENDEDDIDFTIRQTINKEMGSLNKIAVDSIAKIPDPMNLTINQNETDIVNVTGNKNVTKEELKQESNKNKTNEMEKNNPSNLYPDSNGNNTDVNSIFLTTAAPDNLPPLTENRWKNFTVNSNLTFETNEATTKEPDLNQGSYPAALYNAMIDQISITTNQYTNEESPLPPKNDRWRAFSSKIPYPANEFKPLAGLYYDGFLHKPLIMLPGFIPRKYYNLY